MEQLREFKNFKIDGKFHQSGVQNLTVLEACSYSDIDIPRFCYHRKLSIAGNCRMCLVEVVGNRKLVASCAALVFNNINILTNTSRVRKSREGVLELLLYNHPLDCPICDQAGECDLQDITMKFGSDRGRFYELEKRAVSDKYCGPFIKTSMNRCIHCTRCVRFGIEIAGSNFLGTTGRGVNMEIGTYIDSFEDNELSGNIVDLCPVGALTSKPYSFTNRPWELKSIESLDLMDSFASSIRADCYGNSIVRLLPKIDDSLNEE